MENFDFDPAINSVTKSIGNDIYIAAKNWISQLDPTGEKLNSYREGIDTSLGTVQIMGMPIPKKLTKLYIALKTLPTLRIRQKVDDKKILDDKKRSKNDLEEQYYTLRNKNEVDKLIKEIGYKDILLDENTWERKQLSLAKNERKSKKRLN